MPKIDYKIGDEVHARYDVDPKAKKKTCQIMGHIVDIDPNGPYPYRISSRVGDNQWQEFTVSYSEIRRGFGYHLAEVWASAHKAAKAKEAAEAAFQHGE